MSIQFSFMNPLCITFFFYCLTSDARSQNKHSSYQIIVQTAAQMKNMMDRLALRHCHTVQANTGTLSGNCCDILFFLFPITDWWSGSNRKLIKSILYLRHVSIDLAHPSAVINGRIRWYNLAGLQRYGEESGNLSEKEKKLPKQNTDKSRQWRWSRTQGGAAGIARWGNRGGGGNKGEGSERLLRTKCKKESEGKKKRVLGLRGRTLLPHTESRLHHWGELESWVAAFLIRHSNPSVCLRNLVRRLVLKAHSPSSSPVSKHSECRCKQLIISHKLMSSINPNPNPDQPSS